MNLAKIAKGTKGVKRAGKAAKAAKRTVKLGKAIKSARKLGKVVVGTRILKKTAETESILAKAGEFVKRSKVSRKAKTEVTISKSKYPESAQHIEDAIKNGHPDTLTIKRSGAAANRKESLKGVDTVKGKDRDEYPPAMFEEGGKGASVRPISSSDNRGAGSSMGQQLRPYPDGTKVKIKIGK